MNRKLILVLLSFLIYTFVSSETTLVDGLTAEQWKQKGDEAFKAMMLENASTHYGKAIEADPNNYLYYYQRALVYSYRGRPAFAIRDLTSVLQLKPDHVTSLTKRGEHYLELGNIEEAKKDFELAFTLKPSIKPTLDENYVTIQALQIALRNADNLEAAGKLEDAVSALNSALSIAKSSEQLLLRRIHLFSRLENYSGVLSDAVRILRINPKNRDGSWYQAEAEFYMKDFNAALASYKRAIKFDPDNPKLSKAIKLTKKVSGYFNELNEKINHEQWNEALDVWNLLSSVFPQIEKDNDLLWKRCKAEVQTRKLKNAIDTCTKVLNSEPENYEALLWRGEAYLMQDEFQAARRDFQQARQLQRDNRPNDALHRLEKKEKMALRKDYYKILGVPRDAETNVIKKAYRKLAMENHPDKHKEEDKEIYQMKFTEITEAYEVLSDAEARGRYDRGEDINPPKMQHNPFPQGFPFKFHFH